MKKDNLTTKRLKLRKDLVRILTSSELDVIAGGQGCATNESEHSKKTGGAVPPTTCD